MVLRVRKLLLVLAVTLCLIPTAAVAAVLDSDTGSSECRAVLGFSQTRNWYEDGGFESLPGVDPVAWDLVAVGGADLHDWASPSFVGYAASPCNDAPTRAVYQLAYLGFRQTSDATILAALNATLVNIRATWPSVVEVDLIPIVGGPNHGVCSIGRRKVDATLMHPRMDMAVASGTNELDVLAGPDLLVAACSDYADGMGHLLPSGSVFVAGQVAAFYAG